MGGPITPRFRGRTERHIARATRTLHALGVIRLRCFKAPWRQEWARLSSVLVTILLTSLAKHLAHFPRVKPRENIRTILVFDGRIFYTGDMGGERFTCHPDVRERALRSNVASDGRWSATTTRPPNTQTSTTIKTKCLVFDADDSWAREMYQAIAKENI